MYVEEGIRRILAPDEQRPRLTRGNVPCTDSVASGDRDR